MANVQTTTILQDGPRNTRIRIEGILDTTDLGYTVIANPATLSYMDQTSGIRASYLRIDKVDYDVEDALAVNVLWGNTTPANAVRIWEFTGRGMVDNVKYQDFNNSKAAGVDGTIAITTQGANGSAILSFTLTFTLVKQ